MEHVYSSIDIGTDTIKITGVKELCGAQVNGCNDHRIVMSAAVCAAGCQGDIFCSDPLSINKSYPDFYRDYSFIGGSAFFEE